MINNSNKVFTELFRVRVLFFIFRLQVCNLHCAGISKLNEESSGKTKKQKLKWYLSKHTNNVKSKRITQSGGVESGVRTHLIKNINEGCPKTFSSTNYFQ